MKKNYQVINTYDRYFGSVRFENRTLRFFDNMDSYVRPNAPMRAKDTLLAQRLRTGRFACPKLRSASDKLERIQVKSCDNLVGKLLGVEIEYYPDLEPNQSLLTRVVDDGSLHSGGREIRRITWLSSNGRLEGLLSLSLKGRIDKKCGLHVHVDCRHLGEDGRLSVLDTYLRLVKLYPHLKKLVPRSRWQNSYCRWVNNATRDGERYAAINYQAFDKHGTLEFRCQGGSTNLVKIETWALLCQFLVNWCAKPENVMPSTWAQFTAILPEPLRSWAILRRQKLHGESVTMNERTMSAVDLS